MTWPYNLALFIAFFLLVYYAGWRASKHWYEHKRAQSVRRIGMKLHHAFASYSRKRDERAALRN